MPVLTSVIVTACLYMNQIKARIQVLKATINIGIIMQKEIGTAVDEPLVFLVTVKVYLHIYLNSWLSLTVPCPNSAAFMPKTLAMKDKGSCIYELANAYLY
jgi:hypothetical protein